MPSRPTLSVVMPNYNHERHLARAIEGFLQQSRPPDEFLILDDASTDDSVKIIESYARRHSIIRLLRNERNEGVIRAHQRLFALAQGDYLHSAAADDLRSPRMCEALMTLVEQYPHAGLAFGAAEIMDEADHVVAVLRSRCWKAPLYASPERYLREYLELELATQSITTSAIYRRDAFFEAGGYHDELTSWADTFAMYAVALKYGACYTPEILSQWRMATGSYSGAGRADPRRQLEMVGRAARLMRSAPFCDRFPASFVRRWERDFRRLTIWSYWLGADLRDEQGRRPSFLARNLARLPRAARALALSFYRGGETQEAPS